LKFSGAAEAVVTVDEANDLVYIVECGEGERFALDKQTGEIVWYKSKAADNVSFKGNYVLLHAGKIFAAAEVPVQKPYLRYLDRMLCINASSQDIEIIFDKPEGIELFDLPRTYRVERDLDGVRDALYIHPTIIEGFIERPETEELTTHQNIRILGTPGIGKTTAIYTIIERSNPELVVIITDAFTETDVNRLLREDLDNNFLLVWDKVNLTEEIELKELRSMFNLRRWK
jgi:hypothetical protein